MSKIRVVIIPADEKPYITEIENELKAMQKIVDGYIETCRLPSARCTLIVNEEGIWRRLKPNKHVVGVVGTAIAVSDKITHDGEMTGLSKKKADELLCLLGGESDV